MRFVSDSWASCIFLYHSGTVIQVSWKLWMFLISPPHKTRTFTVQVAVTTKYQGNGFAAEVLLGRDHPRVVPIGPIVRGVIAFPILGTWWDATTMMGCVGVIAGNTVWSMPERLECKVLQKARYINTLTFYLLPLPLQTDRQTDRHRMTQ